MKYIFLTFTFLFLFAGCSAKEMRQGTNEIVDDITNAFEGSKDTSSDENSSK